MPPKPILMVKAGTENDWDRNKLLLEAIDSKYEIGAESTEIVALVCLLV